MRLYIENLQKARCKKNDLVDHGYLYWAAIEVRRLTQKELGLLMGYSEKTADVRIAQYEKNARTPNAETTAKLAEVLKVSPVVFSPTICASREDLLQSMYWLFLMKGGGDIYDCETEYARSRMEQKLGVITVEEFLEKILVN